VTAKVVEETAALQFGFTEENFPRIDGSTATIPLIAAARNALLGDGTTSSDVSVSTTNNAYYSLANGNADVLFVYYGGEEIRKEVDADERFETVPIGKDALVFLAHADNPVENLTTEQVQKIFSGEITNWSEVGGSDEEIRAYQRTQGSGSQALMDKLVMQGVAMGDPVTIQTIGDMGGLIDAVASYNGSPTGIGYNVFFYVTQMRENDSIKIISIDGVEPTYETIASGEYPFVSEFYSIIRKDEPEDSPARALHDWMLTEQAQNIMASINYVALSATAPAPAVSDKPAYPEGERPEYFEGLDYSIFEPGENYGNLHFYVGSATDYYNLALVYGLCTQSGKIVTDPIYTNPFLLTDSGGNSAYYCVRTDLAPETETVYSGEWSYVVRYYPALLLATDGSWVKELEAAQLFRGVIGAIDTECSSDIIAVRQDGSWGAMNLKGEMVLPYAYESAEAIYGEMVYDAFCLTSNRYLRNDPDNEGEYLLYDGQRNQIASGILGYRTGVSGEFFLTSSYESTKVTFRTYTLDGELISEISISETLFPYAAIVGENVLIQDGHVYTICDRYFNPIAELEYEASQGDIRVICGGFYMLDADSRLYRTYLSDGTRLVTWYDSTGSFGD